MIPGQVTRDAFVASHSPRGGLEIKCYWKCGPGPAVESLRSLATSQHDRAVSSRLRQRQAGFRQEQGERLAVVGIEDTTYRPLGQRRVVDDELLIVVQIELANDVLERRGIESQPPFAP